MLRIPIIQILIIEYDENQNEGALKTIGTLNRWTQVCLSFFCQNSTIVHVTLFSEELLIKVQEIIQKAVLGIL